ncbi:MAG: beta-glucosidase, partial [Bacteroidales bacterium]|nr:beta-glucosidase [Bacteroidales bacterium]
LYYEKGSRLWGRYGFYDAYNPGLPEGQQLVRSYLAIDQGPVAVMMENYRSGLIWKLFMQQPEIKRGLQLLGFSYP